MMALFVLYVCFEFILSAAVKEVILAAQGTEIRTVKANNKIYFTYNQATKSTYIVFPDLINLNKKNTGDLLIANPSTPYNPNAKIDASEGGSNIVIAQGDALMSFDVSTDHIITKTPIALTLTGIEFWEVVYLSNGNLLVVSVKFNIATFHLFNSAYTDISPTSKIEINMRINRIACIQVKTTKHILCAYSNDVAPYDEYYTLYDEKLLQVIKIANIEPKAKCQPYGEKMILLDDDRVLVCPFKLENQPYLYCLVGDVTPTGFTKVSPFSNSNNYAVLKNCELDIKYISTAKITKYKFVNICLDKTNKSQFVFSVIDYTDSSDMSFDTKYLGKINEMNMGSQVELSNLVVFSSGLIGLFFTKSSSSVNFELLNGPNCEDYTVPTPLYINSDGTFTIPSSNFINGHFLNSDPIYVSFILDSNESLTIVNATNLFLINDTFHFNSGKKGGDVIHEFTAKKSPGIGVNSCKLTFTVLPCFTHCSKCTSLGNASDMKCDECDESQDYYPYTPFPKMCYHENAPPPKTFLDIVNKIFVDCYTACNTCNAIGDSINMNCLTCDESQDYYPYTPFPKMCYHENTPPPKTFLDTVNKIFVDCYTACNTCSGIGDSINMNCLTCDIGKGHYPYDATPTICYTKSSPPPKTFFDSVNNKFVDCYIACNTCNAIGDSINMNCLTCDESQDYYPYIPTPKMCYHENAPPPKTFLDTVNKIFVDCYTACNTCSGIGDSINMNCLTCDIGKGHYPYDATPTICYTKSSPPPGAIFDSANDKFVNCYIACSTCSDIGNPTNMNCVTCNITHGYYPYDATPTECYTQTSPPPGTVLNPETQSFQKCFVTCNECSAIGDMTNMNCKACDMTNNYYPLISNTTQCYGGNIILPGTYLDTLNQVYKFCTVGCATCIFNANVEECQICDIANQYYPLSDSPSTCVNEITKPPNYYLENNKYHRCHSTCATCSKKGTNTDHNCDTCAIINSIQLIPQPLKATNCVEECPPNVYWYVNDAMEYICTTTQTCPITHPYFVEGTTQCTSSCSSNGNCDACNSEPYFKVEKDKLCVKKCPQGTQANIMLNECEDTDNCQLSTYANDETPEDFTKIMDQVVLNYSQIYSSTDKQVDEITNKAYRVVIYKNETCAYSLVKDLGKLDLAECIATLHNSYSIPLSIPLITLTMDLFRVNQTNQVAYALYHPINGSRLNMKLCEEEKVIVTVPIGNTSGVDIDQAKDFENIGVDVYNESDPFFNDICFEYSTADGKDVTLSDRKKNYYQNVSVCEEGCSYKGVDLDTEEVSCECEVKTDFITELLDNPLTGELLAFINQANFEIIKCYEDVFNLKKFLKNIGSWIVIGVALIQLAFGIFYSQVGVYPVHAFLLQYIKVNPPKKNKVTEENRNSNDKNSLPQIEEENPVKINFTSNSPSVLIQQRNDSNHRLKLMNLNQNYIDVPDSGSLSSGKVFISPQNDMKPHDNQITNPEGAEEYEEYELNDLELEDAIDHDKRGFWLTYWRYLQESHTVIKTFFAPSPLESFPIKVICFLFSITLFFTVNALFYDESYISQQFNSDEPFNLFYMLKNEMNRCIYSTIVAIAVNIILSFLFSSKRKIRNLIKRHKDNQTKLRSESLKIVRGMKITNISFIVVNYILMFCFWYFISAFCAIFPNSQGSWLIGCGVTWFLTFLFPFALSFLAAGLRFIGLRCKCEMFYRLSQILS